MRLTRAAGLRVGLQAAALAGLAVVLRQPPDISWTARPPAADLVLVLDVSASMLAADVHPDRLTAATRTLADAVASAPARRMAVVAFAGDARIVCPLTADAAAVRQAIAGTTVEAAARGGSDVASALEKAGELLDGSGPGARMLLLADGEAGPGTERDPIPVARALAGRGITLSVVGLGTETGAPLDGVRALREGGVAPPHVSRRDRVRLAALATAGGGTYADLELGVVLPQDDTGEGTRALFGRTSSAGTRWVLVAVFAALLLDAAVWWLRPASNPW